MHPDATNFQTFENPRLTRRAYRNPKTRCNCMGATHKDVGCIHCARVELQSKVESAYGPFKLFPRLALQRFNATHA